MWSTIFRPNLPDCCVSVIVIPCWEDNYAYIVYDKKTKKAVAIDAVEPESFKSVLESEGLLLQYILTTHHHKDHSGGNSKMHEMYPEVPLVGIRNGKTPNANKIVDNGESLVFVDNSVNIRIQEVPCHTMDHVTFTFYETLDNAGSETGYPKKRPVIFTGDFLFVGGCGRFFEGSPTDMYRSIKSTYGTHSLQTYMFSGHEYGLNNMLFAHHCEPDNIDVRQRIKEYQKCKTAHYGEPSSLEQELKINPFVRCVMAMNQMKMKDLIKACTPGDACTPCGEAAQIELLGRLREMKDHFRPQRLEDVKV